jgi:hypothetical protein
MEEATSPAVDEEAVALAVAAGVLSPEAAACAAEATNVSEAVRAARLAVARASEAVRAADTARAILGAAEALFKNIIDAHARLGSASPQ